MRFGLRVLGVLLLALVPCSVVSSPAVAAPAPWRFATNVDVQVQVAGFATQTINAPCPASYVLVGGGYYTQTESNMERVWDYRPDGTETWQVRVHNYSASPITVDVYAVCALDAHVGAITRRSVAVANAASGQAGGTAPCLAGERAIFGGADWNDSGPANRRLDGSAPSPDGTGWLASGWTSNVNDSLTIDAYCIATSELGGKTAPRTFVGTTTSGTWGGIFGCMGGDRLLSGGGMAAVGSSPDPLTEALSVGTSRPEGPKTWTWTGHTIAPGTKYYIAIWCIPASQPTFDFTNTPAIFTNSTSANFTFTLGEQTGEQLTVVCELDGQTVAAGTCPSGSASLNVSTGHHQFTVDITNISGQLYSASFGWDVDADAPGISDITPASGLTTATEILFDEPVTGISGTSIAVELAGTSTKVPGNVQPSGESGAVWFPKSPLIAGEQYEVVFTNQIKDLAGNALAPQTLPLVAPSVIESEDDGVVHQWDTDKSKAASGGSYATSRLGGSSLAWTFQTTSGQSATLYGVRMPKGGKAEIYVDGDKVASKSFYAASTKHGQEIYTSGSLSAGTHKLRVRVLGTKVANSKGTWVSLDRLKVGGTNVQESAAHHRFRSVAAAEAGEGSYATVDFATKGDTGGAPSYTLKFRGDQVSIVATLSAASGSAKVFVDGVLKGTPTFVAGTTVYHVNLVKVDGLSDSVHTLKVVPVGTKSGAASQIGIDTFDATPSG